MSDFCVSRKADESAGVYACRHLLERMRHDGAFVGVMLFTETLHKCVEAVAESLDMPVDKLKAQVLGMAASPADTELAQLRSEIKALAAEVHLLRSRLQSHTDV